MCCLYMGGLLRKDSTCAVSTCAVSAWAASCVKTAHVLSLHGLSLLGKRPQRRLRQGLTRLPRKGRNGCRPWRGRATLGATAVHGPARFRQLRSSPESPAAAQKTHKFIVLCPKLGIKTKICDKLAVYLLGFATAGLI